ncbi:39S ribosomal protein L13, mitochondrial, partial [Lacerta agilis]|uniref:39S ribosomal protein L13, mitochondrial n=1 Tax=Lacerta agilis TaxID=80427 RepID=UPI001419498C
GSRRRVPASRLQPPASPSAALPPRPRRSFRFPRRSYRPRPPQAALLPLAAGKRGPLDGEASASGSRHGQLHQAAQQWATFARAWYLIDAKMQPPGKIAAITAIRLQGKHKPVYHALSDLGDHVVIINTRHIAFSGNKWEQKVYSSHTGYPGGFRQVTAAQLHLRDPTAIVKLATYGMLPKNLLRRTMMQRLHIFADDVIPEEIRKNLVEVLPQPRKVPKRFDEYTQEEIGAFPRLWNP